MPSIAVTSHAFAGRDDLRARQAIVSADWADPSHGLVHCTVGDLEWWLAGAGPGVDWSNAASEALYRSVGFDEIALQRRWTRRLEG